MVGIRPLSNDNAMNKIVDITENSIGQMHTRISLLSVSRRLDI